MSFTGITPYAAQHIDRQSAELRLLDALCAGDVGAAAALFAQEQQFGGQSYLDAPQGRFEGKAAIEGFLRGWLGDFAADSAEVTPVTQTQGGGRSASEVTVHFCRAAGDIDVPMCIVGDLRPNGMLDAARLYFYYDWVPGFSAYRRIVFKPEYQAATPVTLLTGCVKKYFDLLHADGDVHQRIEDIAAICAPDVVYGGYRPDWVEPADVGLDGIRMHYLDICTNAPENYIVRIETLVDDGVQAVVEWTLVVSPEGYAAGRVSQSGVAVYERDRETGLLRGIRICDNVGQEENIDLDALPDDVRPLVAAHRANA